MAVALAVEQDYRYLEIRTDGKYVFTGRSKILTGKIQSTTEHEDLCNQLRHALAAQELHAALG